MPNGSSVRFEYQRDSTSRDTTAPECTPKQVFIPVVPGQVLSFRNLGGTTNDTGSGRTYGLDGDKSYNASQAAANGINTTKAPLNSMLGVFLDNRRPDATPMNPKLDFSTESSRDFTRLSPGLKQAFFIGDGIANGQDRLQEFVVPPARPGCSWASPTRPASGGTTAASTA